MDTDGWVPMRWPCGPLEIERTKRRESSSPREVAALAEWCEPRALDLLASTPVNCLVLTWADGSAGDEGQQRALGSLITGAQRRGLSVVGWVADRADLRRAADAARAAGLAAIASESREPVPDFDVLRFREHGLRDRSRSDFVGVVGTVWPGIRVSLKDGADAETGPTGPPWLDSNAWYVRLARSLADPKVLWLAFDPPEIGQPVAAASYVQAIADTEVYGGRWVVSLDPHLRVGLLDRRSSALETWAGISRSLAFFKRHRAWTSYFPMGQLGVVSDYAGAHEFLSFEVLNLLARQGSLYRILEKAGALAASFDGLDAVLYVDQDPPGRDLVQKLYAFAEAGGTLITPPGWEERGVYDDDAWLARFRCFRHGRGRLAVARAELADPYQLAEDAQLLMSHRHDRVRAFNAGTTQLHYAASGDGGSGVLHALRFETPSSRMPTTVWFDRSWAGARAWGVDDLAPLPVARAPVERGVEFQLPLVPLYCALELSA